MTPSGVGAVILAAGGSTRFGSAKQLAPLGGRPLVEWAIGNAAIASLTQVVLVLGARADEIRSAIDTGAARVVINERWAEGPGTSLQMGLAELESCEAAVVLLGDQPFVGPAAIERVVAARAPGIVALRATYAGDPGHPVLLERRVWGAATAVPSEGARSLFARPDTREVECDDLADAADIDTPADLEAIARRGPGAGDKSMSYRCHAGRPES